MPFFSRRRSSSPIFTIPNPDALPSKTVGFVPGPTPVTSISRTLTNDELWALYYFETHARICAACRDPYSVHRAGGRLCSNGHKLAQAVASFVWSKADGQETFDATFRGEHLVRIEMPQDYGETRSLLRAMERSLRHRKQTPIVSFSKSYAVPTKPTATAKATTPERRSSVKGSTSPPRSRTSVQSSPTRSQSSRDSDTSSPQRYERRLPEIVDWPEAEYEIRQPSQIIQPSRAKTPEFVRPVDVAASPSKTTPRLNTASSSKASTPSSTPSKTSSPSRRSSNQPVTSLRTPLSSSPEPIARPRPRTFVSEAKDNRRQSMYAGYGGYSYDVEVREPKARPKRFSTLFF